MKRLMLAAAAVAVVSLTAIATIKAAEHGFLGDQWQAQVVPGSVYDGDTFKADVRLGNVGIRYSIRVSNLNAPEIKHNAKCQAEHEAGLRVRDHLRNLLDRFGGTVVLRPEGQGGRGRLAATVLVGGENLTDLMAEQTEARYCETPKCYRRDFDWCAHLGGGDGS